MPGPTNTARFSPNFPKVAGLVLAAGASTRMGSPKQLLPVSGHPLIHRVLKAAIESKLDKVVLVLGHEAAQIEKAIYDLTHDPKLQVVRNPDYLEGMSTSIRAGLKVIEPGFDHMMIILADMPHIDVPLINRLLDAYFASGRDLGAITIAGRRSHPVIFSRKFYPEFYGLKGDVGGRRLFDLFGDSACFVDAGPSYTHTDIDTPEDYENLKK